MSFLFNSSSPIPSREQTVLYIQNKMDTRLFEAALTGNVDLLHQLLLQNPLILHSTALASAQNPLHVASIAGNLDFVKEIVKLKPGFAKEVNQDGFSPMHLASANGHLEIVREILQIDTNLCRLEGRDRKTPFHCAAMRGRADVVREMLSACALCFQDVNAQRETSMHLAIKNGQVEVIIVLVEWAREMNEEDVLNAKDEQGNTILHLATWKKQRQVIELLVGNTVMNSEILEVNAINKSGLTALDMLSIFPSEAGDREIEDILIGARAKRARDIVLSPEQFFFQVYDHQQQSPINNPTSSETHQSCHPNNLVEYFKFRKGRDSPGEVRSAFLVIAVLVATATFQVGLSPPGGIWQDNSGPNQNSTNNTRTTTGKQVAGQSILGTSDAITFSFIYFFNSIGFSVSLYMINILTSMFPMQLELQLCMIAMYATYNTAVITIAPGNVKVFIIVFTSILPSVVPLVAKGVRQWTRSIKVLVIDLIRRII